MTESKFNWNEVSYTLKDTHDGPELIAEDGVTEIQIRAEITWEILEDLIADNIDTITEILMEMASEYAMGEEE